MKCQFHMMWCVVCFKQKTAYEMRISDWSSDVCSSDLFRRVCSVKFLPGVGGDTVNAERRGFSSVRTSMSCAKRRLAAKLYAAAMPCGLATGDRKSVV